MFGDSHFSPKPFGPEPLCARPRRVDYKRAHTVSKLLLLVNRILFFLLPPSSSLNHGFIDTGMCQVPDQFGGCLWRGALTRGSVILKKTEAFPARLRVSVSNRGAGREVVSQLCQRKSLGNRRKTSTRVKGSTGLGNPGTFHSTQSH